MLNAEIRLDTETKERKTSCKLTVSFDVRIKKNCEKDKLIIY